MEDSKVFRVFPNEPRPPFVDRAEGVYIYTKDGQKLLDITSGGNHYAVLGWAHPEVNKAMEIQIKKFGHMDYKLWSNENTEELAELLVSRTEHGLDLDSRVETGFRPAPAGFRPLWMCCDEGDEAGC